MKTFRVEFKTDTAWATTEIVAQDINGAFKAAFAINPDRLAFEAFTSPVPVNDIQIADSSGTVWKWRSDERILRLAAEDLLEAALRILSESRMELLASGPERAILTTFSHLKDAVERTDRRRR